MIHINLCGDLKKPPLSYSQHTAESGSYTAHSGRVKLPVPGGMTMKTKRI